MLILGYLKSLIIMIITLFHLPNSRSQRVLWLLEEIGCEYQVIDAYDIDNLQQNLPTDLTPLKFPTVHIQDVSHSFYMTETSAICDFLSKKLKILCLDSPNDVDLANFCFWKNYADANLMQLLVLKQVFKQIVFNTPYLFKPIPFLFKVLFNKIYLSKTIEQQLKRVNAHLENNTWMCENEFTIADILMWFPLNAALSSINTVQYPFIKEYLNQIQTREKFQQALLKGKWSKEQFIEYWK